MKSLLNYKWKILSIITLLIGVFGFFIMPEKLNPLSFLLFVPILGLSVKLFRKPIL